MRFYKIQSNRLKIKQLIRDFGRDLSEGEILIAPRPEPGKEAFSYFALVCVEKGSRNEISALSIKIKTELSEAQFYYEKESVRFFWKVP